MLTEYIYNKLLKAKYKLLDDGTYFADIPGLQGVWGSGTNLESCREDLRECLEEWLLLKIQDGDKIPGFPLNKRSGARSIPILKYA
jgi:predicted RNase H-like HicB family nuclease